MATKTCIAMPKNAASQRASRTSRCGKTAGKQEVSKSRRKMVGAARFELATSCTPSKRASRATLRPDRNRNQAREDTTGETTRINDEDSTQARFFAIVCVAWP